jgi:mannose-6-phosphate isomerase-like protein (cupin superfamily)
VAIDHQQIHDGRFRVTKWTIAPSDRIPLHLHELDYVVVPLVGGILHVVESDGTVSEMELISGASYARESGVEHIVINRGSTSIEFVEIERL